MASDIFVSAIKIYLHNYIEHLLLPFVLKHVNAGCDTDNMNYQLPRMLLSGKHNAKSICVFDNFPTCI